MCFPMFYCGWTGKAPPNLPPGVPPLLPNPYIMAPGLLHAYPVSSWERLTRCVCCLFISSYVSSLLTYIYLVLYRSLRCTAMMTYRCCRQEYHWWVWFGDAEMCQSKFCRVTMSFFFCRIITASPLQLPPLHWLAEKAAWQTILTLVSHTHECCKISDSVCMKYANWPCIRPDLCSRFFRIMSDICFVRPIVLLFVHTRWNYDCYHQNIKDFFFFFAFPFPLLFDNLIPPVTFVVTLTRSLPGWSQGTYRSSVAVMRRPQLLPQR